MAISPVYANSSNQIAALKELYKDPSEVLKDMVYQPIWFKGTFITQVISNNQAKSVNPKH